MSAPRNGGADLPRNDDEEVAAWVRARIAEMDSAPPRRNWRYRALGVPIGVAIAEAPRDIRVSLKVPVGEMRIVRDVARDRGVPVDTLLRRAIGTWMVACAEVDPAALPFFCRGGMIGR